MKQFRQHTQNFLWRSHDKEGKHCKGQERATHAACIEEQLSQQGHTNIRIRPANFFDTLTEKPIKKRHINQFNHQLSVLLQANIQLKQALELISQNTDIPALRSVIADITRTIESGNRLSYALSQHPTLFSPLYISLIKAGETSGQLPYILELIRAHDDRISELTRKIKKATLYPLSILFIATIVTILLLTMVVPIFAEFFADSSTPLPWLTQMVMAIAHVTQQGIIIIPVILAIPIVLTITLRRTARVQLVWHTILLKSPLIGRVSKALYRERFTRMLALLLCAGMPLRDALTSIAPAIGNTLYQQATMGIVESISQGNSFTYALKHSGVFDHFTIQMIRTGESSGNLMDILIHAADHHASTLDSTLAYLTTLLEPIIMSIVALIVGTLVIAMYLPLFSLGQALG